MENKRKKYAKKVNNYKKKGEGIEKQTTCKGLKEESRSRNKVPKIQNNPTCESNEKGKDQKSVFKSTETKAFRQNLYKDKSKKVVTKDVRLNLAGTIIHNEIGGIDKRPITSKIVKQKGNISRSSKKYYASSLVQAKLTIKQ